ncbi:DUF397 domain-containing protein [Streptomyces sp. DSM 3412]|uniref:DUF397 domain-containing protein n=1 Tax=Streptomyces gottesmaniae TaxID=3075518 RepID=A0ABU2Z6G7_9ACTN|nr:DUF397 domain-containing protein [Streptomyces sp. DSM 3412]MDT0572184.1 DUF397 domain-containing protein [Streptomyces sp. DSM 3412]
MRSIPEHELGSATWHKSSYSGGSGGNCLEVTRWHKSSYSGGDGGNCLEVTLAHPTHPTHIPVRDSKNPLGPKLVFRAESWSLFIEELKRD